MRNYVGEIYVEDIRMQLKKKKRRYKNVTTVWSSFICIKLWCRINYWGNHFALLLVFVKFSFNKINYYSAPYLIGLELQFYNWFDKERGYVGKDIQCLQRLLWYHGHQATVHGDQTQYRWRKYGQDPWSFHESTFSPRHLQHRKNLQKPLHALRYVH